MQGGDFNYGNGYMGESIYGQRFRAEKYAYSHSRRGILSMANSGHRHSQSSQFFITFGPCTHLDRQHVVFGQVESGWDVLDEVEKVGTEGGYARRPVEIYNCDEVDRLQ